MCFIAQWKMNILRILKLIHIALHPFFLSAFLGSLFPICLSLSLHPPSFSPSSYSLSTPSLSLSTPSLFLSTPSLSLSTPSFWAAAPEGTKSCRIQGESVRTSVRPYIHTSVRPPPPGAPLRMNGWMDGWTWELWEGVYQRSADILLFSHFFHFFHCYAETIFKLVTMPCYRMCSYPGCGRRETRRNEFKTCQECKDKNISPKVRYCGRFCQS